MPENPVATTRPSRPGKVPSNGRVSGVMSYTPVTPHAIPASANIGTRRAADSTMVASSSNSADAGARSGSAIRSPAKAPTNVIAPEPSGLK